MRLLDLIQPETVFKEPVHLLCTHCALPVAAEYRIWNDLWENTYKQLKWRFVCHECMKADQEQRWTVPFLLPYDWP